MEGTARQHSKATAWQSKGGRSTCRHTKVGSPSKHGFSVMLLWWDLRTHHELGHWRSTTITARTSKSPVLFHGGDVNPTAAQQLMDYPVISPPPLWSSPQCWFCPKSCKAHTFLLSAVRGACRAKYRFPLHKRQKLQVQMLMFPRFSLWQNHITTHWL